MPLYLATPGRNSGRYDVVHGFVIRAKDEAEAKTIAVANARDEGEQAWYNGTYEELDPDGPSELVLRDFKAG